MEFSCCPLTCACWTGISGKHSGAPKTSQALETALRSRVASHDPTVTEVRVGETQTVDVPPGQDATIFTGALSGGTVAAVLSRHGDGTRSVTLCRYSAMFAGEPLGKLDEALKTTSHAPSSQTQHEMYVLVLGEFVEDAEGEPEWRAKPDEAKDVAALETTVQARLPHVQATVLPYRVTKVGGQSDALILTVPAGEPVRYDGKLHGVCGI